MRHQQHDPALPYVMPPRLPPPPPPHRAATLDKLLICCGARRAQLALACLTLLASRIPPHGRPPPCKSFMMAMQMGMGATAGSVTAAGKGAGWKSIVGGPGAGGAHGTLGGEGGGTMSHKVRTPTGEGTAAIRGASDITEGAEKDGGGAAAASPTGNWNPNNRDAGAGPGRKRRC